MMHAAAASAAASAAADAEATAAATAAPHQSRSAVAAFTRNKNRKIGFTNPEEIDIQLRCAPCVH